MSSEKKLQNDSWRRLVDEVAALLQRNRLSEAESRMADVLEEENAPGQVLLLAGMVAFQGKDYPKAVARLRRAASREPDNADIPYNLGVALLRTGDSAEAADQFRASLVRRPDHLRAATNLAETLITLGRHAEAAALCRDWLAADPAPGPIWLALGEALRREQDSQGAERALEEARGRLPREPAVLNRLAMLKKTSGRTDQAVALYREALTLAPGRPDIWNNLGIALLAAGSPEEALEAFDQSLERRSAWPEALANRSVALVSLGRRGDAEQAARRAVEAAPGTAGPHAVLAAVLSANRDPERLAEAEQCARAALRLDPDHAGACDTLGLVLRKRGEDEAGLAAARRAVTLAPGEPGYAEHLGDHLARLGRLDEACQVYRQGLGHNPGATALDRQLGIARLRLGDHRGALRTLDRRLEAYPQDQRAIAHRAVALACAGRLSEANALLGQDRFIRHLRIRDVAPFPDLQSFNAALARDIREHPTLQWEPVGLAAAGGALTGELMDAPTQAIRVFERNLRRAIDEWRAELPRDPGHPFPGGVPADYRLNTWATLVPEQGRINAHIHEQSWLSGAYYAALPAAMNSAPDERAGWLEFGRTSADLPALPESSLHWIEPEEGLLVLFPSYLFHRTLPFRGAGERISLSFDVEPLGDARFKT